MDSPQYLVRKVETCTVCHGEKFLYNPEWAELNRLHDEQKVGLSIQESLDLFERMVRDKWPHSTPPPEEEPCHECEGAGKIETWIDLRQVLQELGVSMLPPDLEEQQVIWESLERKG